MPFYLVLHGSGQQHLDTISKHKPLGDTLSIIADIIPPNILWECVGPERIFGFGSSEHTAMALYKIIEQTIKGETEYILIAHSRGACQAIAISHFIDKIVTRIQSHLEADKQRSPEDLKNCIAPESSSCNIFSFLRVLFNTRKLLRELNSKQSLILEASLLKVKINLLLTDPVPGIHASGFVSWKQAVIFKPLPKSIVSSSLILYAQHENIWAFDPVVPSTYPEEAVAAHEMDILPGRHSSFGGNFFPKNKAVPTDWDYHKVSDTQLITIYRFLEKILQLDPHIEYYLKVNLSQLYKSDREFIANKISEFIYADIRKQTRLYVDAYDRLRKNKQYYLYLIADTAVISHLSRMILWASTEPRQAFIRVSSDYGGYKIVRKKLTEVLGVSKTIYINKHHEKLSSLVFLSPVFPVTTTVPQERTHFGVHIKSKPQARFFDKTKIEYSRIKQLIKTNILEINNSLITIGLGISLSKLIRLVLYITVIIISKFLNIFGIYISWVAPPESTSNKYARLQRLKDKYNFVLNCTEEEYPSAVIKIEKIYTKAKQEDESQSILTRKFGWYRKTTTDLGKLCFELRTVLLESAEKRPSV